METFFTFPDGALGYDCASCRQRCCRGKGFSFAPEELVPLLRKAPSLAPHLQLRGGTYSAIDLTERCWFLADDGFCKIEVEHGRDAKPSTCRLFPFNRVFRLGNVRIVDVNSMLCPVEKVANGVTHASLLAEIEALQGSPLLDVPSWQPQDLAVDWLETERRIQRAAVEHAGNPAALSVAAGADSDALHAAWVRVYGISPTEIDTLEAAVAPRVALIYSSLRWNALFKKGANAYPKAMAELPARLRALTFLGALAARSLGAPPSLRGLTEIFRAQAETIDVLVKFSIPVKLSAPKFDADIPAALQGALGVLLGGAFRGGKTLGELVEAAAASLEPSHRSLAVALAAQQLDTLLPLP